MLYFHGNAEDLGLSYEMLDHMRNSFRLNILAVEYPAYGIYEDPDGCSENVICEDAQDVIEYVFAQTGLFPRDILLFGRSLGSGPATYLASRY